MQTLFNAGKMPLFLDNFTPGVEKRHGEDVKIITLTLRLQPFSAQQAAAVDEGLGGDSNVKASLFSMTTAEKKPHIERVNLALDCPLQNLHVFAAPDIQEARIVLTQCEIDGVYARVQKNVSGYAFVFRASFGPVGRDELEFLAHWHRNTQFVTFEEAEPRLPAVEKVEAADVPVIDGRPAPMWDDGDTAPAVESDAAREVGSRPTAKRGTRSKAKRHDPEAEALEQAEAGRTAH